MIMCKSKTLAALALVTLGVTHVSAMNNPMGMSVEAKKKQIVNTLSDYEDDDDEERTCSYCGINQKDEETTNLWDLSGMEGHWGKFLYSGNEEWVNYVKDHVEVCQDYMENLLPDLKCSDYIGPFTKHRQGVENAPVYSHIYINKKLGYTAGIPTKKRLSGGQIYYETHPVSKPRLSLRMKKRMAAEGTKPGQKWDICVNKDKEMVWIDDNCVRIYEGERFIPVLLYGSQKNAERLADLIKSIRPRVLVQKHIIHREVEAGDCKVPEASQQPGAQRGTPGAKPLHLEVEEKNDCKQTLGVPAQPGASQPEAPGALQPGAPAPGASPPPAQPEAPVGKCQVEGCSKEGCTGECAPRPDRYDIVPPPKAPMPKPAKESPEKDLPLPEPCIGQTVVALIDSRSNNYKKGQKGTITKVGSKPKWVGFDRSEYVRVKWKDTFIKSHNLWLSGNTFSRWTNKSNVAPADR